MGNEQHVGSVVLVTGATGRQGGAVVRHLLDRRVIVRALVRDLGKAEARMLAYKGVDIVQGSLDRPRSVKQAVDGVHAVFSVQNFWETGYEREVRQGTLLADAAKAAGVRHFVYSSVGSAYRNTGIPHFESKWEIEQYVRRIALPYTILRPTFFMQNWYAYSRDSIQKGTLAQPLNPKKHLQQISVDDIGAFAAMAFANPDQWLGRELDLAGDELNMPEVAQTLSQVIGRKVKYVQVPWDEFRRIAGAEMTQMYEWFNTVGYEADIAALRKEYPQLSTLERALRTQNWTGN
jgi:uncharacterized protein YbjT (DUF2867 family)